MISRTSSNIWPPSHHYKRFKDLHTKNEGKQNHGRTGSTKPAMCCLQETHLINRKKHWLRVKGWKKIYQANSHQRQAGAATLISDKVDFKLTLIKWDKEGHSIRIIGEIHQKKITIINLYAPNINAPNFIKHTLTDLKHI
jgi:exonuclease III